ncbi:MAG: RHS repeat-associated core domain-containing protein [Clostridia bacterium]|nr:RHS repeat-associated core domain-containing protein [Clostridia bacterium]
MLKCRYVYDAWGNHKVYDENGVELLPASNNIGNINPFRYRGYYWDREFGLYYLQTRYYDPVICRFISADAISYLNPGEIMGLNLYCYCANNPVMNNDPNGTWNWGRFFAGLAIVTATIAAVALTVATFGTGSVVGGVIIAGTIGVAGNLFSQTVIEEKSFAEVNYMQVAISGASSALSAIPGVGYFGSIAVSGAAGTLSALIDKRDIKESVLEGLKSAGITAIAGGITRAIGLSKISKIGKGNYSGKKVFLNHIQPDKLSGKLSSFNPSVNKTQSLIGFIKQQVGLRGLSRISNDTAGNVVNTISDIITSIIP